MVLVLHALVGFSTLPHKILNHVHPNPIHAVGPDEAIHVANRYVMCDAIRVFELLSQTMRRPYVLWI